MVFAEFSMVFAVFSVCFTRNVWVSLYFAVFLVFANFDLFFTNSALYGTFNGSDEGSD